MRTIVYSIFPVSFSANAGCPVSTAGTRKSPLPQRVDVQSSGPVQGAEVQAPDARPTVVKRKHAVESGRRNDIVRILAGTSIHSLDDIAGKQVSFGLYGDPHRTIARSLFSQLGIKAAETPLDIENALDGVATGDVAAVVMIGDHDLKTLRRLGRTDLHLLPIPAPTKLPTGMTAAVIPAAEMPTLTHGQPIRTLAVAPGAVQIDRRLVASAK